MTRRDRVTPAMALEVFERDGGCIAPQLGGTFLDCWGRLTIEHVKSELRMGRRAPSDRRHLVALCEGHTEPGMKAGFVWNTNSRNRAKVRDYLARVEGVTA